MVHTKEEHDLHMNVMISNLARDEAAFAMNNYPKFNSNHEAYGVLLEELDESIEALESVKKNIADLWTMIKADWSKEEISSQLNKIAFECKLTVGEVTQVYAVALKAIEQLGGVRCKETNLATSVKSES